MKMVININIHSTIDVKVMIEQRQLGWIRSGYEIALQMIMFVYLLNGIYCTS